MNVIETNKLLEKIEENVILVKLQKKALSNDAIAARKALSKFLSAHGLKHQQIDKPKF